jgi:hypothetical protein
MTLCGTIKIIKVQRNSLNTSKNNLFKQGGGLKANHFSTIGIPLESKETFFDYAEMAINKGKKIKTASGTYSKFNMGQGVELWGQLNHDNEIIGINPHFTGTSKSKIRLIHKIEDPNNNELDGKIYAESEPGVDGEFTYPFVFDMPDMAAHKLSYPVIREVQLAAFAHELSIWKDEEEYENSQSDGPKFASESFIPSGLFSPDGDTTNPPQAMAIFTGHVLHTSKIENKYTGAFFYYSKVKTLGAEIDVVADPELVDKDICVGGIVSGSFWLSGKLIKKRFKLFGR